MDNRVASQITDQLTTDGCPQKKLLEIKVFHSHARLMPMDATVCGETPNADSNTLKEKIDRKPEELGNYPFIVDAYNPGSRIKISSNCDLVISAFLPS